MDANDRCINLGKKFLPIVLPFTVEAEKFSDHPRKSNRCRSCNISYVCAALILKSLYTIFIMSLFLFGREGGCDLIYVGWRYPTAKTLKSYL